jgi:hypothetical protein
MKQLSKMMLAAVASVAFAATAFAWDFSASGSSTASFNSTSTKASKDATNTISSGGVTSSGSSLSLASSHTDGAKSVSMSYVLDWDGNLDETITVSGSDTVGGWTASGSVSYNRDRPGKGCIGDGNFLYNADNQTAGAFTDIDGANIAAADMPDNASATVVDCPGYANGQTGEDTTAVTLTDGTMTITLGDASHLSSQNVSSGSAAAGAISFDSADDDASVGAFVGSFSGVSLAYKISDTMSATVAYQKSTGTDDACGAGEAYDSEGASYGTTATGLGFNGTFGIIALGVTICNATTADVGSASASPASNSTATSTMGLGVAIDLGDIDPFISFGTYSGVGSVSKQGAAYAGNEVGLTYALGADTVVLYIGSVAEIATASGGTAGEAITKSGMELGYNTTVGPASLQVGYGTQTHAQTGGATDGYSMSDIEVAMTYSF